jgi:L-asparaginase II
MSDIAAVSYRGPATENTHAAHVAVVDARGTLLWRFGDPYRPTLPRSAIKPAQALAVLESGAFERYALDEADLALCCASHNSEPRHIERARGMLAAIGASEAELRCGSHAPLSEAVYRSWIKAGYTPSPLCSNCSGKHAGMLAAARALGLPSADYHAAHHPLQVRVAQTVAQLCDLPEDAIAWGIDGCNLPTPSFALDRLARVFAKLAAADAQTRAEIAPAAAASPGAAANLLTNTAPADTRTAALARLYRAMTRYPELVAGEGRFCTALMQAYEGTLVGKVGADASYALGYPAQGLGLAVKVEDGNTTVVYALVVELLHQLQLGTPAMRARLDAWRRPSIVNTAGIVTGHIEPRLKLAAA